MSSFFASAVIVAGGTGSRMGRPKQVLPLGGKPVVVHSILAFKACACVKEVIVVTPQENRAVISQFVRDVIFVDPGDTRLASVQNGVARVSPLADVVAVHDGARPLVDPESIMDALQVAFEEGASVLAVPVKDTIKEGAGGVVVRTLERAKLWAAQTPQCYKREILKEALAKYGAQKDATDESQLVEKLGVAVQLVPSDYTNFKITTPEDLLFAETLMNENSYTRTGFGFDLHRLGPDRKFMVGGVTIPHDKGFIGHSDGDLVLHALCDALLGALCAGEIGLLFPPTDPTIKGIDSKKIAKKVVEIVRAHNGEIVHVDATLITQEPKIKPHYEAVRKSLAEIFEIPLQNVSFKSKSHEHVGEIGRGEAAMCHAVATVKVREK